MLSQAVRKTKGFTLIEMIVVFAIMGIMCAIAVPQMSAVNGQMKLSEDIRKISYTLNQLRSEAIRLRTDVRVSFTSTSLQWDINDDGTNDGSINFNSGTEWVGAMPTALLFNGLGLLRSVATSGQTLTLTNKGYRDSIFVNKNGNIRI